MKQNNDYKNEALAALKGNWGKAVLATLVYFAVVVLLLIPYLVKSVKVSADPTDLEAAKSLMGTMVLYIIGLLLVGGPLLVGLVNSFKVLFTSGDSNLVSNEFKIGFGNWLHNFWGYLLKNIFIFLWSLLLYIPGIIKSLSYAMTNYILVDNPELSANQAINLSKDMMYGHKFDLFYLYLSFAGWFLLCILTLGLGYLWFYPYVQSAQASFYQDVKADWEARKPIE